MRLHFTIRDLFWLTLVVAMGLGWWIEHRQATEYKRKAEFTVGKLWGEQKSHLVEMLYEYEMAYPRSLDPPRSDH